MIKQSIALRNGLLYHFDNNIGIDEFKRFVHPEQSEESIKQRKISRRHIMRYFTALCSVQYDKRANNVILSEAEGSLKQRKISRRHIKRYFTALCSVQYDKLAKNDRSSRKITHGLTIYYYPPKADGLNLKFCHTERSEVSQSKSFEILPTVRMTNTID